MIDASYTDLASHYRSDGTITSGDGFEVTPSKPVEMTAVSIELINDFSAAGSLTVKLDPSLSCASP